ncbi:hypothetical protein B0H14DRAFT_2649080 [Mycena olivaceomarginata]|nr:hypothetical protein B0H14DRAFT_2649080 [Mycena olivaceomarginata]
MAAKLVALLRARWRELERMIVCPTVLIPHTPAKISATDARLQKLFFHALRTGMRTSNHATFEVLADNTLALAVGSFPLPAVCLGRSASTAQSLSAPMNIEIFLPLDKVHGEDCGKITIGPSHPL